MSTDMHLLISAYSHSPLRLATNCRNDRPQVANLDMRRSQPLPAERPTNQLTPAIKEKLSLDLNSMGDARYLETVRHPAAHCVVSVELLGVLCMTHVSWK